VKITSTGLVAAARKLAGILFLLVSIGLLLLNGAFETPLIWNALCPVTFGIGLVLLRVSRPLTIAWLAYVTGFLLFIKLRLYADDVAPRDALFEYVVQADRNLFGGELPTLLLQDRFYELGSPTWWILTLVAVYVSYAIVPHLIAWVIAARKSLEDFWRYIAASMICYYSAVAVAVVAPTAPPWLAGQSGYIRHVYRVTYDVIVGARPETYDGVYPIVDGNSVAAMPSLHMAIAVISACGVHMLWRRAGALGVTYAILMGLALVALGEHYVIDILAGVLLAAVAWRLSASSALRPDLSS